MPPRDKGLNTVEACKGMLKGEVRGFIGLGGNFVRAIPERDAMEAAWRKPRLTVRSRPSSIAATSSMARWRTCLPCRGRTELDQQESGPQSVTTEDSTSYIHASYGLRSRPAPSSCPSLRSSPA